MPDRSTILVLNGVGSVGKSSVARALQQRLATPFLHVQMDSWIEMLPDDLQDNPSTFSFVAESAGGMPSVAIHSGPLGDRLMAGFRASVAAMADAGLDLIVDDVMLSPADAQEYRRCLERHDLRFIGLRAPLTVLEQRERLRGDRMPGLARWQFDRVHRDQAYDLQLEMDQATPGQCAEAIILALGLNRRRSAKNDFSTKNQRTI